MVYQHQTGTVTFFRKNRTLEPYMVKTAAKYRITVKV